LPHPFKLLRFGTDKITVYPGTIDGYVPVIGTDPIDIRLEDGHYPNLTIPEGSYIILIKIVWVPYIVTVDGEDFVTGGGSVDTLEIDKVEESKLASFLSTNTEDPTTTTNGTYFQRIGKVTYDGTVITYINNDTLQDSMNAHFCAPNNFFLDGINS